MKMQEQSSQGTQIRPHAAYLPLLLLDWPAALASLQPGLLHRALHLLKQPTSAQKADVKQN